MGVFEEMDPELARRAIEGYQDELTGAADAQNSLYSHFTCPRCKCPLDREIHLPTAFTGDGLVAKNILRCGGCQYAIDPHTNMVISFGDASKTPVEALPIIGGNYLPDP